ncbi:VanZ family protein [Halobacillus sp. K22]|uniref:VanZ family protein n=1 Tax=Halobacillus sp. K22 TaxID=3457431 RepID=UPI003FCC5AA9
MFKNVIYQLLPVTIMIILFIFSSQPYEEQNIKPAMNQWIPVEWLRPLADPIHFTYHGEEVSVETQGVDGVIEFLIRKSAHFFMFFLLMVTLWNAIHKTWRLPFGRELLYALCITVLYAAFDEFHQSLTPNRTPYIGDVMIDTAGALTGVVLLSIFYKRLH